MKSFRFALSLVLVSLSTAAFAQHEAHATAAAVALSDAAKSDAPKADVPKSEARKSFDRLKTLAGSWEGPVTTANAKVMADFDPSLKKMDGTMKISLQVTSSGKTITHEMSGSGPHVNPITMFYLDGDQLELTHYCAMGNRPRMVAKTSPDGNTVDFEFLDVSGSLANGHMHHAVFTFIDADHHNEDWDFYMPGADKPVRAHAELHRVN